MQLFDKIKTEDASLRVTNDGYLVAMPRVARTGIQLYKGDEVGRPEMPTVKVMRPEAEIFSQDSLHSFAYRPLTNDHPPVPVTAGNWRKYSVGLTAGDVVRDGEFVRVPMALMDAAAIKAFKDGKAELSVGYTCDLKWEPGEHNGVQYDAVQTNVRANHIALVSAARGGEKLRFGDLLVEDDDLAQKGQAVLKEAIRQALDGDEATISALRNILKTGEKTMNDKTTVITVDGVKLEIGDTAAAIVNRTIQKYDEQVTDLKKDLSEKEKELEELRKKKEEVEKDSATKDAKITTLEAKVKDAEVTPDKLDAMVKDRAEVIGKAKAVLGDKLVVDGKTLSDIRRQVVSAKVGDAAKDWNEDQLHASFAALTADMKPGDTAVTDMNRAFAAPAAGAPGQGYTNYDKKLTDAWKQTPAA